MHPICALYAQMIVTRSRSIPARRKVPKKAVIISTSSKFTNSTVSSGTECDQKYIESTQWTAGCGSEARGRQHSAQAAKLSKRLSKVC
jgi:hypothetical protein